MNCITHAECKYMILYADQMNNLVWGILKLWLSNFFKFTGFHKAFKDELQIMNQKYFNMALTRKSKIYRLIYGCHGFQNNDFPMEKIL